VRIAAMERCRFRGGGTGRQARIAKERMAADGVGPLAPVAANDAEAGRAKNRRVEMVLLAAGVSPVGGRRREHRRAQRR